MVRCNGVVVMSELSSLAFSLVEGTRVPTDIKKLPPPPLSLPPHLSFSCILTVLTGLSFALTYFYHGFTSHCSVNEMMLSLI